MPTTPLQQCVLPAPTRVAGKGSVARSLKDGHFSCWVLPHPPLFSLAPTQALCPISLPPYRNSEVRVGGRRLGPLTQVAILSASLPTWVPEGW